MNRSRYLSWAGSVVTAGMAAMSWASLADARVVGAQDPISAKAFEVRYRPLNDAAELVSAILSADGKVTLEPRLKILVVEDHGSLLDRVGALLQSFDLPPRSVEVTVSLIRGTDKKDQAPGQPGAAGGISREIRGVTETLGDFTKWTAYEQLGSRSVTGVEGSPVTVNLSEDYRVVFEIDSVQERQGVMKIEFKRLSLQRLIRAADGGERTEELYNLVVSLPPGKLHMIGAAKSPDSKQALFLALQAKPR